NAPSTVAVTGGAISSANFLSHFHIAMFRIKVPQVPTDKPTRICGLLRAFHPENASDFAKWLPPEQPPARRRFR
ncbi:MAG: hypothetical protein WAM77_14390, partial [Xanthobacteraceae bacterium]